MTIKELIDELKDYPLNTEVNFVMVDRDWEDVPYDPYIEYFGIVGSGETMDDADIQYLDVAFKVTPESREDLKELLINNDEFEEESDD